MGKISSGSLTVVDVKGGSDGINTATIYLYQRAATAPSKPSTNLTYTFATAKLTGGLGNWTQDIGTLTGSDPIWVIAAVASSNGKTDVIEPTEWSEPIKMAQDGQDGQPGAPGQPGAKGLNQATVFIYKRDDSVEKPNSVTYTFATGSFAVPTGWSTSIPQSNGKPCWVCSAVAIGSDDTAQLSWTNPSVMVEDGSDGVSPVVTSTDNGVQIYDPVNDVTYTITNGVDGTSYYTHILYSSKATPTSASDVSTSPTGKDYVGIQTTTSRTAPSWNDSGWQWMKYVGNDGTSVTVSSVKYAKSTTDNQPQDSSFNIALPTVGEGEWLWTMTTYSDGSKVYTKSKQGKSGTSVTVSKTEYQAGTSATTAPTGEWKTTIPSVAEGQYLWTKTTYSDGNYSYTVAKQGKSGTSITISSTSVKYQVGTSATTAPTGEWKDTVQSTTTGQYLWTRTIVTYSDGSDTTSYSVSAHGATGTSISISSIKYATSTTDSQPADSSFGTSIPTVSEGQWLWTMTTYSNGSKMYTKSKQGKSGVSVTKTRELYYLKTNSTNVPTITAASQITATDRENGWTSIVPTYVANGTYYTCIETSLSVGGPVWSTPVENQGLTDANANAAESLSVSTHANENAQGALSISRATQQHFWFVPENIGSGASLIEAGAYITDTAIDTFKSGKNGGYLLARSDGVELGRGTNKFMTLSATALNFYRPGTNTIDATLTSKGLILSKGGIEAGTKNTTNYIYIYSDDDVTNHKLTINSHEASDWRIVAGKNFGVDKAGNLYASGANIQGKVTVTSGSNVYTTDGVNPLEIGGRNLLSDWAWGRDDNTYTSRGVTVSRLETGLYKVVGTTTETGDIWWGTSRASDGGFGGEGDYIYSIYIESGSWPASGIVLQIADANGTSWSRNIRSENGETHVAFTIASGHHPYHIGFYSNAANTQLDITFRVKLERGNKATDWTPAPEDVQAEIDAKKSVHTLSTSYSYNYSQLLIYANDYTTGWTVSSTTGVKTGDTVRLKMSVKDMSNAPVYLVGTVTSVDNATRLTMTSHGLDTTIIDGGNILTNSIGANQIAANSLTIGKIATDDQDKILNSNIEIGGRNLLIGTAKSVSKATTATSSYVTQALYDTPGQATLSALGFSANDEVTLSFDWKVTSATTYGNARIEWYGEKGSTSMTYIAALINPFATFSASNTSGHVVTTVKLTSATILSKRIVLRIDNSNLTLTISNLKLEKGNKATDWSPAPEDLAATATSYITDIGNDGIRIHDSHTTDNSVVINSNGMEIFKGGNATENSVASYGEVARIGAQIASSSYIYLEPASMTLYGTNSSNQESPLFKVGNLLSETDEDNFIGDGIKTEFLLTSRFPTSEPPNLVVKVNGTTKIKGTDYFHSYKNDRSYIVFNTAPAALADITVAYTLNYSTPYVSIGSRKEGSTVKPQSFTIGKNCEASGNFSHAFGVDSKAITYGASADGYNVTASGEYSHAEGKKTTADGNYSHAEGYNTKASGDYGSHAEGQNTKASGDYGSHAEGLNTTADGDYSHAEGYNTTASDHASHAEGYNTTSSGGMSHAEGMSTKATSQASHAEGYHTTASGRYSHADGYYTIASGESSYASGCNTEASGTCSRAIGRYSIAQGYEQVVIGRANVAQGQAGQKYPDDLAFIIGNGTADNARSNAFTVAWNGDVESTGQKNTLHHNTGDVYLVAKRDDTNVSVGVGVDTGGANHGLYSFKTNKWIVYNASDGYTYTGTHLSPGTTSTSTSTGFYLGLDAYRWRQLYSYSAPNVKSDKKDKDIVGDLEYAKEFIMGLKPIEFQWKGSDHKRIHMGFIAQDVAEAGKKLDKDLSVYEAHYKDREDDYYGGEETDDEKLSWSMMYEELIAPMVKVIQNQEERIAKLETLVEQLLDK